jgi:hypothetical protein
LNIEEIQRRNFLKGIFVVRTPVWVKKRGNQEKLNTEKLIKALLREKRARAKLFYKEKLKKI